MIYTYVRSNSELILTQPNYFGLEMHSYAGSTIPGVDKAWFVPIIPVENVQRCYQCVYCGELDDPNHTHFICDRWVIVRTEATRKTGLTLTG